MTDTLPTLLVVDDKKNMLSLMSKVMKKDSIVKTANNGADAVHILATQRLHAVLCDLRMPDMDGLEVLKACKKHQPQAQFVLMTAFASVGTAVDAIKLGAFDYLAKPFEPQEAKEILLLALARGANKIQTNAPQSNHVLPGVIARSKVMREVAHLVTKIADSNATTLIVGDTGTGKERIARAVHDLSPRSSGRFVALNCAAIPPELLESELFGHARGAFTGASHERKGLFEEAIGGSLFLDEIGDLRPSLQAKLTRVLEEKSIRRVGENKERLVDVRVIAATHRPLQTMVADGTFREDLWYRLNVALVQLPPLRERQEDIELLASHFLHQSLMGKTQSTLRGFSPAALHTLLNFAWPGNVRQLASAVERAALLASGELIELTDLPPEISAGTGQQPESPLLVEGSWAEALEFGRAEIGRRYLNAVLKNFEGKISEAAQHAGIERESFYRLLRKHGVDAADFRKRRDSSSGE